MQKRLDMLPKLLTETLCSLTGKADHFAFTYVPMSHTLVAPCHSPSQGLRVQNACPITGKENYYAFTYVTRQSSVLKPFRRYTCVSHARQSAPVLLMEHSTSKKLCPETYRRETCVSSHVARPL